MQTAVLKNRQVTIWARLLERDMPKLSRAAAQSLLTLEFPPEDRERMHELAARARAGSLSAAELEEAEDYAFVGSLLSILKSKARRVLKTRSTANGSKAR
jgi:hypothetical protein